MLSRSYTLFDWAHVWACVLLCNLSSSIGNAFVPCFHSSMGGITTNLHSSSSLLPLKASSHSIVVISPEGGLGEITAVEAAKLGASVKWFIIYPSSTTASTIRVNFNAPTLASFTASGGSIQFASSDATSILGQNLQEANTNSLDALCTWAGNSFDGLICTWDHPLFADKEDGMEDKETGNKLNTQEQRDLINAIKIAVQKVSGTNMKQEIMRVALSPSLVKMNLYEGNAPSTNTKSDGLFTFLNQSNNENKVNVPSTIQTAMSVDGKYPVATLRYGTLFGTPSSSPDVSPFIGGLRKDPILRDEYTMRSIRMDSTSSVVGNMYSSSSSMNMASSRLSLGEAAARLVSMSENKDMAVLRTNIDVSLSSLKGMNAMTHEEWNDEFSRLSEELLEERQTVKQDGYASNNQKILIYKTSFGAVPSKERLAEWIETKWAPTILRSYDIAGIRVGARPVYATRRSDRKDMVEIVWQDLRDFQTILVGRMEIQIMDTGLVAYRTGPSLKDTPPSSPLSGEDILVGRLADATAQAIEKGLATKPASPKKSVIVEKISTSVPLTTMISSGTVESQEAASGPSPSSTTLPDAGPRTVGTRRSSERARGSNKAKEEEDGNEASSTKGSWQ